MSLPPPPDVARHDVRMDGVYFVRAAADAGDVRALGLGSFSYCFMVRRGRLRLETDFPFNRAFDLGPGDAVAISGLAPHTFSAPGAAPGGPVAAFDLRPMPDADPGREVDIVLGVAPSEALALGSLVWGPTFVGRAEHPDLSRRLWRAVEILEDEYADDAQIDRTLVIRRVAETMAINYSRRAFADRRPAGEAMPDPPHPQLIAAINAFLRAPEQPWTLSDLARAAGMSRTRFAEEFKLVTGETPARIISRLRLTTVARRMASAQLSVEVAADEAGYSSSAAFVRAFQREFGETPARWRRGRVSRDDRPATRRTPPPDTTARPRREAL
ncbi:MAG: helix-turn-helix domain-containing protein [Phenylobacterium sp.]|uniref:helix-turn-helix transcriptional regulator n=1 Tax=Phenylobacterium sp. TaxID=1871053 RepID=UPI001A6093E6|nr:AraC family transcriptional regulator [Phenylobacterium sp.]MBL8552901.1 helix-turn-helix domain-containing protein [Phenylobacterium sp.]